MLETRQTIMNSIHGHIKTRGGAYKDWRIGVCADEDSRTIEIPAAAGDTLLCQKTRSPEDATAIMAYFVYIYDVIRDKREIAFEGCDVVYLYKAVSENVQE